MLVCIRNNLEKFLTQGGKVGENEVGSGIDKDALVEAEIERMKNRRDRHDSRVRDYVGDAVDRNMNNVKMIIPLFKCWSDPEPYLEWEKIE